MTTDRLIPEMATPLVKTSPPSAPHAGLVRTSTGLLLTTFAWILPLNGAGTALLANVLFGTLSNLNRSKFGSRTFWTVGEGSVTLLTIKAVW